MNATFISKEALGTRYETYYFKPDQIADYVAGQFAELYIPHKDADDRGEKRWFTFSSNPYDKYLAITTAMRGKRSSFKQALRVMKPNERVHIAPAMGDFVLPLQQSIPLLFIAAGIGITPVNSMLGWLKHENQHRTTKLLYGAPDEENILFKDTFEHVTEPKYYLRNKGQKITTSDVLREANSMPKAYIYISGPELFTQEIFTGITKDGQIDKNYILTDYFHGYY